ncbi:MAG: hypothetical protein F9K18_14290 [Thermoanaerobaculia bacterium]|nr:MAG: hypothetical protein F9K18_14290 [Thermoanaerobaculia bacterium]
MAAAQSPPAPAVRPAPPRRRTGRRRAGRRAARRKPPGPGDWSGRLRSSSARAYRSTPLRPPADAAPGGRRGGLKGDSCTLRTSGRRSDRLPPLPSTAPR